MTSRTIRIAVVFALFSVSLLPVFSGGGREEPAVPDTSVEPAGTPFPAAVEPVQPETEPSGQSSETGGAEAASEESDETGSDVQTEDVRTNGSVPSAAASVDDRPAPEFWDMTVVLYDEEALRTEVNEYIANGFVPTGIHVITGDSIILLFSKIEIPFQNWAFVTVEELADVNTEVSELLAAGWQLVDFSLDADTFHGLFLETGEGFEGWRVVEVAGDVIEDVLARIGEAVAAQHDEGRYVFGVSAIGNAVSVLFVEPTVAPLGSRVEFRAFENDGESPFLGIEAFVSDGALPAGLAVSEDWVFVPFYF